MKVRPCTVADLPGWLELRQALWPDTSRAEHGQEAGEQLERPDRFAQWLVENRGRLLGFAEASLRHEYVNGTESCPVAFLEGLYVIPEARRNGVARLLVQAVCTWARQAGVHELASDVLQDNLLGQRVHRELGFRETERVVYYRMDPG